MKRYTFTLLFIITLLSSCGTTDLLITEANDYETIAAIDTIQYLNSKYPFIAINASTPFTSADFNRKNITNSWSIDSRFQTVKFGEVLLKLGIIKRLSNLPTAAIPTHGIKNQFHYQINYNYPLFKWMQEKSTPIHTTLKNDQYRYKTLFSTMVERSLNIRLAINNDPFYQTTSRDFYPRFLESKYPYSSSGGYYYSKNYGSNTHKTVLIEQSSTILRCGIGIKKSQNVIINGSHPKFGTFNGKKNKYNLFYADFMLLVASSGISPVNYNFNLVTSSGPYYNTTSVIELNEEIDFEPLVEKQIWGACLGYYQEFYFKSSPIMMSLKTELGIRPGYYHDYKWNENYYLQLGVGVGGWFQLKNKK